MTTPGAVTVINTIEPQNDGAFPVVDDADVKGGHHAVADTTARDAIPDHLLTVGMTVGVADGTVYVLTSTSPKTWAEVGGSGGAAWGDITGTLSDQTDLYAFLRRDDGVTVLGSNTIEASFAADSKSVQTRAADGAITIDGTGYAAQIDVDIQITNTTGSAIAVSVLGAWALIGDAVTEIPAGETLHVVALSRGTVEGDVSYAMGVAVSP